MQVIVIQRDLIKGNWTWVVDRVILHHLSLEFTTLDANIVIMLSYTQRGHLSCQELVSYNFIDPKKCDSFAAYPLYILVAEQPRP